MTSNGLPKQPISAKCANVTNSGSIILPKRKRQSMLNEGNISMQAVNRPAKHRGVSFVSGALELHYSILHAERNYCYNNHQRKHSKYNQITFGH
jgi:hypothetical protein